MEQPNDKVWKLYEKKSDNFLDYKYCKKKYTFANVLKRKCEIPNCNRKKT